MSTENDTTARSLRAHELRELRELRERAIEALTTPELATIVDLGRRY